MRWPARTIWDTRIQGIAGILSAAGAAGPEIYLSATFAPISLEPMRLGVNPNRLHPIEPAIREAGKFAVNVMPACHREVAWKLLHCRRRQWRKAEVIGLPLLTHERWNIPYTPQAKQVLFCELESTVDTGDRTLFVCRVLEILEPPAWRRERVLLFNELAGTPLRGYRLWKTFRRLLVRTGLLDAVKSLKQRLRPSPPPDIQRATYETAGQTEAEIARICAYPLSDLSRRLPPPSPPAFLRQPIGICVAGTGWGAFHCEMIRKANPRVRLYICGRNPEKTRRLARAARAQGYFLSLQEAAASPDIQAFSLALPHHLHREAVEVVAAHGKHALVEKPIATTLADADAMIAAARRAGVFLMVAEDMHFRPALREAAHRIAIDAIGDPVYLQAIGGGPRRPQGWAADAQLMGGGVFMDIGPHYVRALRLLMGEPDEVAATQAMQCNVRLAAEDSIQLTFRSRYGWQAHLLLQWLAPRGLAPDMILLGDRGSFHFFPGARYLDYYPVEAPLKLRLLSLVRPPWLQARLYRPSFERVRIPLPDPDGTGYLAEFQDFLTAVARNRPPSSPAEDGRRDLEIVLCGYQALRSGGWVPVPPFPPRE